MRHHRAGRKLGRDASHRKALYANLAGALIEHGRIKTTVTKAKAVRPIAEQMITLGRRGDLHARRQAMAFLRSQEVVHKLFAEVAPRFKERPGGYSRIVRIGPRPGDAAEMAYLELVDFSAEEQAEEKAERRRLRLRRRQEAEERGRGRSGRGRGVLAQAVRAASTTSAARRAATSSTGTRVASEVERDLERERVVRNPEAEPDRHDSARQPCCAFDDAAPERDAAEHAVDRFRTVPADQVGAAPRPARSTAWIPHVQLSSGAA